MSAMTECRGSRGQRRRASWRWTGVLLCALVAAGAAAQDMRTWLPLVKDGIHDPKSPAVKQLQEPAEALSALPGIPGSNAGDKVFWVEALDRGLINPRTNVQAETKFELRETEVLLNLRGSEKVVRFPHRDHTLWLDCANCHDKLFKKQAGSNRYSMLRILEGEQCGVCHGAVAFPLSECKRCHNLSRQRGQPAGRVHTGPLS